MSTTKHERRGAVAGQVDCPVRPATCSSLCADGEPCSVSDDGQCIGWWSDEAWQASAETGAAMDEKRLAFNRYLSRPDGSAERRAEWGQWKTACNRQRAAEARFAAAVASGPNAANEGL